MKERTRGTETTSPGHRLETTPDGRRGGKEIVRINSPPCPALLLEIERGWPNPNPNPNSERRAEMTRLRLPLRKSRGWNCMQATASTPTRHPWRKESANEIVTETTRAGRRSGKGSARGKEASAAELLLEMERGRQAGDVVSGGMVVYYPMIIKLPANGEYRKMNPLFQGKTIQIIGGSSLVDILGVRIT